MARTKNAVCVCSGDPDNDAEFVKRYNVVLEKAVASFSRVPSVKAPLVNMMKTDIIKKAIQSPPWHRLTPAFQRFWCVIPIEQELSVYRSDSIK